MQKGFTVLEHRKDWILSRAGNRWRAWKSRLRRDFLYLPNGKVNEDPPTSLYPWILQHDWKKFIETCTSEKFKVCLPPPRAPAPCPLPPIPCHLQQHSAPLLHSH